MARRRGLTPDERRLWSHVVAMAVPLRPGDAPPPLPDLAPVPIDLPVDPPRGGPVPKRTAPAAAVDPVSALDRAHPHMDRRRFEKRAVR